MTATIEVIEISKQEIWVGDCKLKLVENVIYNTAAKNPDAEHAHLIVEAAIKLAKLANRKVNMIVDITDTGRPSPEARNVFAKEFENSQCFNKYAFVGANPVARILATFLMQITNKHNTAFFKTNKEALAWFTGNNVN